MNDKQQVELDATPATAAGYRVVVHSVRFPAGSNRSRPGQRIRLELQCEGAYVRHLDISTELARDLWPLLRSAAELGRKPT